MLFTDIYHIYTATYCTTHLQDCMQFSAVRCVVDITQSGAEKQLEKQLQQKQELKLRKAKVCVCVCVCVCVKCTSVVNLCYIGT